MDLDSIKSKVKSKIDYVKSKISKRIKKVKKSLPPPKIDFELKVVDDIFKEFSSKDLVKNPRFAVLGIGNDLKGDDGVGWYVVDKLSKEFSNDKNLLLVKTSVPENHVKQISDFAPKMLIIIDAADFKKSPGSVKTIKGYQIKQTSISTHRSPLTLFLKLYQEGSPVKKHIVLIGIQRGDSEFGQPISKPVKGAGDRLANLIAGLYKKNILDLSLEEELKYLSKPINRFVDYFKSK